MYCISGIRLNNDPSMFGKIPDAPEPIECDGEFREDMCCYCSCYDECKRESEDDFINNNPIL